MSELTVRYDLGAAETDAAIRAKLIEMGWTPPGQGQPSAEPAAYAVFADNGNIRIWSADPIQAETLRLEYGDQVRPLYAAPQPAEQQPDVAQLVEALEACDTALFCDLKTDEEKSTFFLSGRGYETGVIAQAIQNDVAMAYHRCSEYREEMEALQAEREKLRNIISDLKDWDCDVSGGFLSIPLDLRRRMQEAIDAAHRKQGGQQ